MIWSQLFCDCDWSLSSPKLWVPVSTRIQRWRTGGGSEMWRGWNRSKNEGAWPKHLGHCHLELSIILFTPLLWFGMHCVENWSQRETKVATEGCGENTLECLVDVCGTMCFHSCVSAVQISTMSKSASSIQMLLRNTLNSVGKRKDGGQDKLRVRKYKKL